MWLDSALHARDAFLNTVYVIGTPWSWVAQNLRTTQRISVPIDFKIRELSSGIGDTSDSGSKTQQWKIDE